MTKRNDEFEQVLNEDRYSKQWIQTAQSLGEQDALWDRSDMREQQKADRARKRVEA